MACRLTQPVTVAFVLMENNLRTLLSLITGISLATCLPVIADCNFDDFPVMTDMRVQIVMDNVVYNDRPMMVRNFNIEQSADSVVKYYHQQWRGASVDSQMGAWQQISTLTKKCLMTVQYAEMPGAGTFGRLVISNVPQIKSGGEIAADLRLPPDTFVVSDTKTDDGPKKGRVTLLTSEGSVDQVAHFYRGQMQTFGWSIENDFREQGHVVLVFRKRLDESNIVITPAGDATQILINNVEVR